MPKKTPSKTCFVMVTAYRDDDPILFSGTIPFTLFEKWMTALRIAEARLKKGLPDRVYGLRKGKDDENTEN